MNNKVIITIVALALLGTGAYLLNQSFSEDVFVPAGQNTTPTATPATTVEAQATTTQATDLRKTVLGTSVEGRNITAYHYGTGTTEVLFVGGIHGGYEWNTVLVAYQMMNYLEQNPNVVPSNVRVTVIPVLNPDGLNKVVGTDGMFTQKDVPTEAEKIIAGRFNANGVDLNRNFACDWQATAKWQDTTVSGGSKVFSEPESQAIQKYEKEHKLDAVVVWYSAAGGVFASNCHGEVSAETRTLTNLYAKASGYKAYESFDFYATTGDMVNWFAKEGVPAISVLLTNHEDTEWSKNQAGIDALLKHYEE